MQIDEPSVPLIYHIFAVRCQDCNYVVTSSDLLPKGDPRSLKDIGELTARSWSYGTKNPGRKNVLNGANLGSVVNLPHNVPAP